MIPMQSEKATKIFRYLQRELQIPEETTKFSVHFEINGEIVVDCSYRPQECDKKSCHEYVEVTSPSESFRTFRCLRCGHMTHDPQEHE
jgi:hypothetical protein